MLVGVGGAAEAHDIRVIEALEEAYLLADCRDHLEVDHVPFGDHLQGLELLRLRLACQHHLTEVPSPQGLDDFVVAAHHAADDRLVQLLHERRKVGEDLVGPLPEEPCFARAGLLPLEVLFVLPLLLLLAPLDRHILALCGTNQPVVDDLLQIVVALGLPIHSMGVETEKGLCLLQPLHELGCGVEVLTLQKNHHNWLSQRLLHELLNGPVASHCVSQAHSHGYEGHLWVDGADLKALGGGGAAGRASLRQDDLAPAPAQLLQQLLAPRGAPRHRPRRAGPAPRHSAWHP
mmetsp:Transcript_135697/g.377990  ORF Transcript_135697/g.377990 Transcript_135697/m.377990 type:complete len:290 (-) Transcript_135697:550-1419(-)